jgi:hypothetical protein
MGVVKTYHTFQPMRLKTTWRSPPPRWWCSKIRPSGISVPRCQSLNYTRLIVILCSFSRLARLMLLLSWELPQDHAFDMPTTSAKLILPSFILLHIPIWICRKYYHAGQYDSENKKLWATFIYSVRKVGVSPAMGKRAGLWPSQPCCHSPEGKWAPPIPL